MCKLSISDEAKEDIKSLFATRPKVAAFIAVTLEQLEVDIDALKKLIRHGRVYLNEATLDVTRIIEASNSSGYELKRIKFVDLEYAKDPVNNYRIIYAIDFIHGNEIYYILGIMHRGNDYDPNSDFFKRIIQQCEFLGL